MNEQEALARMVPPGQRRPNKRQMLDGVLQIHITRACDQACFNCTQGSNLGGKVEFMTVDQFRAACRSLKGYFGVVGVFGGNPAMHPKFEDICAVMSEEVPYNQRGLWCNHPRGKAKVMRETFNPLRCNLNVHMDRTAWDEFRRDWPEARPFGLDKDSRHAPVFVAMKDVLKKKCPTCGDDPEGYYNTPGQLRDDACPTCNGNGDVYDEARAWELISGCDINQHWSALIGVFRGELRAWFCEIAGAQAMLHQWDTNQDEVEGKACTCGADRTGPSAEAHDDSCAAKVKFTYLDTGLDPTVTYRYGRREYDRNEGTKDTDRWDFENLLWWQLPMWSFTDQVRKHCHECGVPLRGYGELALSQDGKEQVSETHAGIYRPKRKGRAVELVTVQEQLGPRLHNTVDYVGNGNRPKDQTTCTR